MQKGFATLEIILAIFIIGVLATLTIPNAARILDRVQLDYETKLFYTKMRDLQSFDRMIEMRDNHFGKVNDKGIMSLEIITENKIMKTYQIKNRNLVNGIYETHSLSKDFTFSFDGSDDFSYIKFDDMGKPRGISSIANSRGGILDGHIRINSRFNKDSYIIFDSVGRFRGGRTSP